MKRFIIPIIILTTGLTACNILDLEPKDKVSLDDYFKTESDLEMFSNPFYNNLLDKAPFDDQSDVLVELILDEIMEGGERRTPPASGGGWTWTDLRRANTLIEYADNCDDKEAVTHYTAVARFFRAYFYFQKIVRFGDVPWYDVQLYSDDAALYKPRDSRELVMSKMLEDIDYAIDNLPSTVSTYYVNRWSALALKSRFCLFEGTYRKYHNLQLEGDHTYKDYLTLAADAAHEIMTSGPYKLHDTGNPEEDYLTLFSQSEADVDEYILAINFDYAGGARHNASAYTVLTNQGNPGLTRKFINTYLMKDGKRFTDKPGYEKMEFKEETADRDPRLAQSIRTPGYTRIGQSEVLAPDFGASSTGYQPVKFVQDPTANSGNNDRTNSSDCDLPVFRYAEVLLNYAEAKAELGTLVQGDLDISINLLRDRAGITSGLDMSEANTNPDEYLMWQPGLENSEQTGYPGVSGDNMGVILEIRRERTIELLMEGFRFYDLCRWKAGACIDGPIYGMYFHGPDEYDLTGDGKTDLILVAKGGTKPADQDGVVVFELDSDIFLTEGDHGYINRHYNATRNAFNEVRDYLYPIPINERSLNPQLTQNPGWEDGLDF